ncbi:zinc ribbon domain-containing protein [uncultured Methanocorpusculum sp.]|nr:zinc ribbon domain-containing protein [uncultured Methanocorpusculum sp.]
MPYCPECGAEVYASAEICPSCGTRLKKPHTELPRNAHGDLVTGEKSEVLAVILGFFIIGAGLMYAGRVGLGIFHLVLSILLFWTILVPLALWIYGMLKGYELCKENNMLWLQYLEENR